MIRRIRQHIGIMMAVAMTASVMAACSGSTDYLSIKPIPLKIEEVAAAASNARPGSQPGQGPSDTGNGVTPQDISGTTANNLHPLFNSALGVPISAYSMGVVDKDPSGQTALNDYDGDGIPNDEEVVSNPYIADYPTLVSRVAAPITMELQWQDNGVTKSHSELLEDTDTKNTISRNMENRHYQSLNKKTTPYVVRDSSSLSTQDSMSRGYSMNVGGSVNVSVCGSGGGGSFNYGNSGNLSLSRQLSTSTSSERTVFDNVNYVDNLDRSGVELKNDTVERVSRNYRQSEVSDSSLSIGPNAGIVRASLFLKNPTVNMPIRVSRVKCTLTFKTPTGANLGIKTFYLKNDDYSDFDQEIYGGQELGPFVIEVNGLNTAEVKTALRFGYIPQITVVSYDMNRVPDSNYNPGVDNLRIVEETVKARTATIKITGAGMRETFRVAAFDRTEAGLVTPGISLKKALFQVMHSRIGAGEQWDHDSEYNPLTVSDEGLKWKAGFTPDPSDPKAYTYTANTTGNKWKQFSTYVKKSLEVKRDASGNLVESEKRIETIESIGYLKKYNPFSAEDNPGYDPNQPLTADEITKLKYWVILHNGQYFEGDLNDPIWAGERYEIVLYDAKEFNETMNSFAYTPLQNSSEQDRPVSGGGQISSADVNIQNTVISTYSDVTLNTMWNRMTNSNEPSARAAYLGKIVRGDVVKLEVDLAESRSLFNQDQQGREFDRSMKLNTLPGNVWHHFNYTLDTGAPPITGQPKDFAVDAWPGTNFIGLRITPAENARYYTASLWRSTETESQARLVKITNDQVAENGGFITINRNSLKTNGDPVGKLDAGDYRVKVRAHGVAYNVPVSTLSSSGVRVVTVSNPSGGGLPDVYTASMGGYENGINVMVNQAGNAEYYLIDVTGPFNYGFGNGEDALTPPPTRRVIGHGGLNKIKVPTLTEATIGRVKPLTSDEKENAVPGVYQVKVYAVNDNCLNANGTVNETYILQNQGDPQTVMVAYQRYSEQKELIPESIVTQFTPRDVDLEVNFNDGSGWFRLRLAHDDLWNEDRVIDCRYTTSFVQNKQRVTLYFTPPTGDQGPQNKVYNVFRGGAEEADVYVRTVAKPEYRDCVWPKPNRANPLDPETDLTFNPEHSRYVNVNAGLNELPKYDPLTYWTTNANTDVTYIDNFAPGGGGFFSGVRRVVTGLGSLHPAPGDYGVVAKNGIDDFFFAPARKRVYNISASISSQDVGVLMQGITHVDNPSFRVNGGEKSIYVSDIDSQYAQIFDLYWAEGEQSSLGTGVWNPVTITGSMHSYQIGPFAQPDELLENKVYTVCLVARNSSSQSSPVFRQVRTASNVGYYSLVAPGTERHGWGIFANPAAPLTRSTGAALLTGQDFVYGQPLLGGSYDLYNTGTGLTFDNGKCFRIVDAGRNVADPAGLNLTPMAFDMARVMSPAGDECYIDPVRGEFVLPRPVYWSKLEDWTNAINAEVCDSVNKPVMVEEGTAAPTYVSTDNIKFNSGVATAYMCPNGAQATYSAGRKVYPLGINDQNWEKGTVSAWAQVTTDGFRDWGNFVSIGYVHLVEIDGLHIYLQSRLDSGWPSTHSQVTGLYVSLDNSPASRVADIPVSTTLHVYAVWDKAKGLADGKSVRVYINGVELYSTTADLTGNLGAAQLWWGAFGLAGSWGIGTNYGRGVGYVDNIKFWQEVVTEDPTFEYNNGTGREDALHPIYGPANGYRPNLNFVEGDPNSGGVGFYYMPQY